MKYVAILWLLAVTTVAQAAGFPVVKTLSGQCGEDPAFRGSGIAFASAGVGYVLTSEHVVVQEPGSGGSVCHSIQWEDGARVEAVLVSADWSAGLALLRLAEVSSANLPDVSEISAENLQFALNGATVSVGGYPYRSMAAVWNSTGTILKAQSERHLMPSVSSVIEIIGAHGEFGMSGGPVFERGSGKLIGILSHQILRLREGGDSEVESPEEADGKNYNHLLAIPVDFVAGWVQRALRSDFTAGFVRNPEAQLNRQTVIESEGLAFTASPRALLGLVARHGGEDGAGIGGQPNPEGSVIVNVAYAASGAFPTHWPLSARQELATKLQEITVQRSVAHVPYLLQRRDNEIRKVYFTSLESFFALLRESSLYVPLIIEGGTKGNLPDRVQKIQATAAGMQLLLAKIQLQPGLSGKGRQLLQRLALVQELAAGENWAYLTKEDLKYLGDTQGAFREGWKELFSRSFDDTVDLLRGVNSLGCLIGYSC